MNTLVIYAHPYEKSFNHAVYQTVIEELSNQNKNFEVIDLYQDGFNPVYSKKELSLFSQGKTEEPLVNKYQNLIMGSDKIIFIFPIWWNDVPGIVKGFLDLVMKKNFAYEQTSLGVKGKLKNIKKVMVYTTATSPKWYLRFFAGNAINKVFLKASIKQMGIKKSKWYHFGSINSSTSETRSLYLEKVKKSI